MTWLPFEISRSNLLSNFTSRYLISTVVVLINPQVPDSLTLGLFLGAKFCLILPLICIETYISFWYSIFPENVRLTFLVLILLQLTFYSCLFCVDGGTLLEDEEEIYAEERYFCSRCRLYKYYSTRHCSICQKCIRGYDHHCKYFGKCIGRRNVVLFYGFFVFFCACFILSIISALNTIFEQKWFFIFLLFI